MRIRTIKPEFWKNEHLCRLSEKTRLVALALLNYADDEGYFNANPELFRGDCFPFDKTSASVQTALTELAHIDYIRLSQSPDGRMYGFVVKFAKHQRINRASPSPLKGLASFSEDSVNAQGVLSEPSLLEQGTGNRERNREQGRESVRAAKAAPTDEKAWLEDLVKDPAYQGIEVMREHAKMLVWCRNKKVNPSRSRFINWLNRCERPLTGQIAIAGANRHQMPVATKEDHARGFFHGLEDELGIPKDQQTAKT